MYQTTHALAVRKLAEYYELELDNLYLATILFNSGASSLLWLAAQLAERCWSKWLRGAERNQEMSSMIVFC